MDSRLLLCLIGSVLAHGTMIGWPGLATVVQPPRIGGAAQALRVAIAPPASDSGPHPQADREIAPAPQPRSSLPQVARATRKAGAPAAAQPPRINRRTPATAIVPPRETATGEAQRIHEPQLIAPASPARPVDAPDVGKRISAALQHELAKRFEYPWLARKRGWQGLVTLSLKVAENGDLSDWAISRTSGYAVLDRSALDCARRITRLPEAARWLDGRSLQLVIPVHYQLLDS